MRRMGPRAKTANNSERTASALLFFRCPTDRQPRISAAKPRAVAVNFGKNSENSEPRPERGELSEELARFGELGLQRMQQPGFRGRRAIGVAGAEFLELCGIPPEGGMVERQGEPGASAFLHRFAHAVD